MSFQPGSVLGPYTIVGSLGSGGMGDVYRARDARNQRDVAIKALPPLFATDPERLTRFEREATSLASLSHPNIAKIYGVEEIVPPAAEGQPGTRALIMELIEGEDLSARIARGPIPIPEALDIARQIAGALAAAHEGGIIHRDLKPANIKVDQHGHVKVLDFGLAKIDPSSEQFDGVAVTGRGMIVGTAAYMAPEQAKGKAVDKRADVWAFGVVLFEMLTGTRAFQGKAISEIIASVLKDTPALDTVPDETPVAIRRLLRRCLEKERKHRLDSMGPAVAAIEEAINGPAQAPSLSTMTVIMPRQTWDRRAIAAIVVGVITLGAMGVAAYYRLTAVKPGPVLKFALTPPSGGAFDSDADNPDIVLTPDQRSAIVWTNVDGKAQYFVRGLDSFDAAPLGELGDTPRGIAVSPDSKWVLYQTDGAGGAQAMLWKAPLAGGAPAVIAPIDGDLRGASWQSDGSIVYATSNHTTGLARAAAGSGAAIVLTTPDTAGGEVDHVWPNVLPGGRQVLFAIRRANQGSDVALLDSATGKWRVIVKDATYPRYVKTGHLLYAAGGTLYALGFNPSDGAVTGAPVAVLDGVAVKASGAANFDVSPAGTLVYMPGASAKTDVRLIWIDRSGEIAPIKVERHPYRGAELSPDGRQAVARVLDNGVQTAWMIDLTRETATRLTPRGWDISSAVWSPDGQWVAFAKTAGGTEPNGIYRIAANGGGALEQLTTATAGVAETPTGWTSDSRSVLYTSTDGSGADVMRIAIGSAAPEAVLAGPAREEGAVISPDGRWIAYLSDASGRREAYVRPYPNMSESPVQISGAGARAVQWNPEGRELVYTDASGTPFVAQAASGARFAAGQASPIFREGSPALRHLLTSIAPVGGRFLAIEQNGPGRATADYRVVLNWFEELKAKMRPGSK